MRDVVEDNQEAQGLEEGDDAYGEEGFLPVEFEHGFEGDGVDALAASSFSAVSPSWEASRDSFEAPAFNTSAQAVPSGNFR